MAGKQNRSSGLYKEDGSHPFINVKCGNKMIEHPAFLISEDHDRGVSTVRWAIHGKIEQVSSDLIVKELPNRRSRRSVERQTFARPVVKSVSTKKRGRKKKKKESVPPPDPSLLKEAANEMLGIIQNDHPVSPLPSPTRQQDPSSSDEEPVINHKSKKRTQPHSASKRQSSISPSHTLRIPPPDLNVILPPTDYLSNQNLQAAKQDLAPYLNPDSEGIRNDKIESLIEKIIKRPSIKSQEHILFTLAQLKNSPKHVQKALFDTKDPSNAACKIIFNTWLDYALTIMSNKRYGHDNKSKMRSMKGIQTEECIAKEVMNCIKSFYSIHKLKQLNIMKDVFEVDWFQCVKKTLAFAQEHCIDSLIQACTEAKHHLNNIKLKTSRPDSQLHHADFAAGNVSTTTEQHKPKKLKTAKSSTESTKSDQPYLIMKKDVSDNTAMEQMRNDSQEITPNKLGRSSHTVIGKVKQFMDRKNKETLEKLEKTKQIDELDKRRRSISLKDKKWIEEQTRIQLTKLQKKRGKSTKEENDEKRTEDKDKEETADESKVTLLHQEMDSSMYV